jgi:hypothetical protein
MTGLRTAIGRVEPGVKSTIVTCEQTPTIPALFASALNAKTVGVGSCSPSTTRRSRTCSTS